MRKNIPIELINSLIYDPSKPTGLAWKNPSGPRVKAGDQAGFMYGPYYRIVFRRKSYPCHVVVWVLHHGPVPPHLDVDHEDNNKLNNLIGNLRLATKSQNQYNAKSNKNKLGVKGLYQNPGSNNFVGLISHNKQVHRFTHPNRTVVENWLTNTRAALHGNFARH